MAAAWLVWAVAWAFCNRLEIIAVMRKQWQGLWNGGCFVLHVPSECAVPSCMYRECGFLIVFFSTSLSHAGSSGCLTRVQHSSHKSSATHSYHCMQDFHVSKQWCGCQCLGFFMCMQMWMTAGGWEGGWGGCMSNVRESALKVDFRTKIPCCTRDLNPHQYRARLFNWTLYQLSKPRLDW